MAPSKLHSSQTCGKTKPGVTVSHYWLDKVEDPSHRRWIFPGSQLDWWWQYGYRQNVTVYCIM